MTNKEREEKIAALNKLIEESEKALQEAEAFADEHGLEFSWEGPAYGMGGYYQSKKAYLAEYGEDEPLVNSWGEEQYGWQASSQSC